MNRTFIVMCVLGLFGTVTARAQVVGLSGWDIYIDPGHSRTENMGVFGYSEAEKNLRVGLALREMLLTSTDIDTVYISRTNDQQFVSLSQRSDHANTLGAAWYHSIHSDAGSTSLNRTLLLWGQLLSGVEKTPRGGNAMADIMVDLLTRGMRTTTRGSLGDCGFYRSFIPDACSSGGPYLSVNRRTTMPSELSEAGFHTNPVQNTRNMNAEWKRLEAKTLFWSILKYHNISLPSERIVTGFVSDLETGDLLNGVVLTLGDSTYTTDAFDSLFNRYSTDPSQLRNGFYYFENVAAESRTLTVTADGFKPLTTEIAPVDTFFTFMDIELIPAVPPVVVASSPLPDSTHRIIDIISIEFSRKMDRTSVEDAFHVQPHVTGRFFWNRNDFGLIFVPDSLAPVTDYTLTISETAQGVFGDGLDGDSDGAPGGDFILSFRTGFSDVTPPRIETNYPLANERNVERQPIVTFTYDEILSAASITPGLVTFEPAVGGPPVPGSLVSYAVARKGLLSFFPDNPLAPDVPYRVTIQPGVRDLFGNADRSIKQLVFTTGDVEFNHLSIDTFDNPLNSWKQPQESISTVGIMSDSTLRSPDTVHVNLLTGSKQSMRLDYSWDSTAPEWLIRVGLTDSTPRAVVFDSTSIIQAYVFGDGSGNLFRFAVEDNVLTPAASRIEAGPWVSVDWYGWRLISWNPVLDGVGTGEGDGSVEGTLRFDSIQLSHTSANAISGVFYIDDLRLAREVSSVGTGIVEVIPSDFRLHQNFPNPFSPTTTIQFDIAVPGRVTLKIYNMLGAEVTTLTDRIYGAGSNELVWDASGLPSGMYIARIQTDRVNQSIKLMLLK